MNRIPTPQPMTPRQAGSLVSAELLAKCIPDCITQQRKRDLQIELLGHLRDMHATTKRCA